MAGKWPEKSPQSPEKLDFSGLFLLVRVGSSGFLTGNFDCDLRKIRVFRHGIGFAGPRNPLIPCFSLKTLKPPIPR
jgi:hypothetical protein